MKEATSQRLTGKEPLRRQFSWTLSANAIYGACNLLLLVVLNKLELTSAAAGKFSLALAITAPIFMFANLRFSTILASDMQPRISLAGYFQLRLILLAAAMLATACLLFTPGSSELGVLLVILALVKTAEGISDLCSGVQQRIERVDRVAVSLVSNGFAMIGFFSIVYYLTRDLSFAALGLLAGRLGVLALYDIPVAHAASKLPVFATPNNDRAGVFTVRERLRQLFCSGSTRAILLTAAPLGVTAALLSLCSNIPRYIIALDYGDEMLGLFCSVAVVLQAGNLVFRAIEQPVMPRLAQLLHEKNAAGFWKLLMSLLTIFFAVGAAGCVGSLLIGPSLLSWMFNPTFRAMGGVLALMSLATALGQAAGMIESSLIAARLTTIQMPMHFVTVLSCFVLSIVLIPTLELYGAVLAMSICRFPFIFVGVLLLRRKLGERPDVGSQDAPKRTAA